MKDKQQVQIRPFQANDHDYLALIDLNKLLIPEEQQTVELLRDRDKRFATYNKFVRVLGEVNGKVIASGARWVELDSEKQEHQFSLQVHPDYQATDVPQQLHDHILAQIEQDNPQTISSDPNEDELYRTRLLEKSGFQLAMRFPRSIQDATIFDRLAYQPVLDAVAQQGIQIVTLTEVMAHDPAWRRNVWHLFTQINQDVPYPDPEDMIPFEEYAIYYEGDLFRPDSWSIALDMNQQGKQQYVGMCVVNIMPSRPDTLFAGITGVIRSYRRRKIATVLKICSVDYARQHGFRYIYTDNEENNPMYQLNLDLGFKPLPASVYYAKKR